MKYYLPLHLADVLADDMLGSFAIALLIVSLMVTASSWDYMKGKAIDLLRIIR